MHSATVTINDERGNVTFRATIDFEGNINLNPSTLSGVDKEDVKKISDALNRLAGAGPVDGMHRRGSATR